MSGLPHNVYSLPISIVDDAVVSDVPEKKQLFAEVIPGKAVTYRFGAEDEEEYHNMYRVARFAFTCKKGGWDCLRHYEILANGCIPLFEGGEHCPSHTMTSFPKELAAEACSQLLPWRDSYEERYKDYVRRLLDHTRMHCTSSATAHRFLAAFADRPRRVLMIRTQPDPNYLREFLWIGLKRVIEADGGTAVCFPDIPYHFSDFDRADAQRLHGFGYCYTRRLERNPADAALVSDEAKLRELLAERYFDAVIFGKVGPDEGSTGTLPNLPLWDAVSRHYGADRIAFLYGGDGCQDLRSANRYSQHLLYHAQFAKCFVRELIA